VVLSARWASTAIATAIQRGMGNPRKEPWAMGRKEAGTSVMGQPLVSPSTRPEAKESIPSVTMNGAIPT